MKKKSFFPLLLNLFFIVLILYPIQSKSSDWPIYKGNIYFTGNNDEIIVKNSNLKWLFQADERVFNPIISDGRVFFLDKLGNLYCVDEEYGKLIWKVNVRKISARFKALSRSAGKVKYPLIQGNTLFLSDPIAIYAFNKNTGKVLWARTGMRTEKRGFSGMYNKGSRVFVDSIYSNPVIHENKIYYGTRNMFMSRNVFNGRMNWDNSSIKTFSGFPTFYDDKIFTQSMDYSTGRYTIHCLKADTGNEIWSKRIPKPMKIFPPVIYKGRLYVPSSKSIYCLNLKNGDNIWSKDFGDYITSNPSFTDRAILFSIGNSDIAVIDPQNGNLIQKIKVSPRSGPLYVTVRDQLYIAYNGYDVVKKRRLPYGRVSAVNFSDKSKLWNYKTPFPGAVSQPASSKGILFFPAGNYLYAIGTEYYAKVIDGGDGFAVVPGDKKKGRQGGAVKPDHRRLKRAEERKKIITRKMKIEIKDKNDRGISAIVDIKKRDKTGKTIYLKRVRVNKKGQIDVPTGNDVELVITSPGYVPKKVIINNDDKKKKIILEKIESGKKFVVDNINFEFGKSYLKKKSLDLLDKFIAVLKKDRRMKIEVSGHTDNIGKKSYNKKLSERRADSVVEYMIKNGISPERLNSVGFGEDRPIASNKTKKGRRKNRRTEFLIK